MKPDNLWISSDKPLLTRLWVQPIFSHLLSAATPLIELPSSCLRIHAWIYILGPKPVILGAYRNKIPVIRRDFLDASDAPIALSLNAPEAMRNLVKEGGNLRQCIPPKPTRTRKMANLNPDATLNPPESTAQAQPSFLRKIFIGKDGIRAGWSLLIFIAMLAAIIVATHFVVLKFHHPPANAAKTSEDSAKSTIINESVLFFVVLVVTWIMSKIERRPSSVYGLGGSRKVALFFAGLAWGIVCLSLLVLALWKTGLLVIDSRLLFGSDILRYGAIWLLGFLLVGLFEEYLFRGYIQYTLTRGLAGLYSSAFQSPVLKSQRGEAFAFWTSAVILSVLFSFAHGKNPGESPIGLLAVVLIALVFCFSLWRTGSLWWAIGFHASWDWAQSFLCGVADSGHMAQHHLLATHPVGKTALSGGATGPEGSIFIVGILGLICLIIFGTLRRARYTTTM
jgi:uncharacterized protein